jgi:hypothetical protein
MCNRVVARVRVSHFPPITNQLAYPFTDILSGLYSLSERVLHTNDGADIDTLVELLRLHIGRDVNPDHTTGLVPALYTGTGTEAGVERRLTRGPGRCGNVEGIAACGGAADAREAGNVPDPRECCC